MKKDPLFGYNDRAMLALSQESPLNPNDIVLIYSPKGGIHTYCLTRIKRVVNEKISTEAPAPYGGRDFYMSGENTIGTCESRLIPTIETVVNAMGTADIVVFGSSWRKLV